MVGRPQRGPERGFSLIEALVALSVVMVALVLEAGLQTRHRAVRDRLASERLTVERVEAVVESVRAGLHPLRDGPIDEALLSLDGGGAFRAELEVEPTSVPGVCHLRVLGRSVGAASHLHEVTLETRVWHAGGSCS